MFALEACIAGASVLVLVFYHCAKRYIEGCRVSLLTADSPSSSDSSLRRTLLSKCPSLTDPDKAYMVPTPYLFSGLLHTYYSARITRRRDADSDIQYERETRVMSDGGTVSLDWYPHRPDSSSDSGPIAIVIPGVGGTSGHVWATAQKKYRVVVLNHRGCARTPLTSPVVYGIYHTEDIREVVAHIRSTCSPSAKLVGVAFSMGANLLTKYVGEEGDKCPLSAAVSVCCAFNYSVVTPIFEAPSLVNDVFFRTALVSGIKRMLTRNVEIIQSGKVRFDMDALQKATKLSEFDTLYSAPLFGFKDCWDYYEAASSSNYVDRIATPYLAINSADDRVTPPEGIPMDKFRHNPNTALALVGHGGHLGFFTGLLYPKMWFMQPVLEFLDAFV
ncbi:AB-hydrolase YheT [Martensiomyces pterosporus]|nr:AB-hydrolase YheT [Martensiomyces pterosporus]